MTTWQNRPPAPTTLDERLNTTAVPLVHLTAFEAIVPRGTRRVGWHLLHEGQWVNVQSVAGVELTRQDPGPGLVWETRATLRLPRGAWLRRVEVRPRPVAPPRDPLVYLQREVRLAEVRTQRSYYQVRDNGTLQRFKEPPDTAL